MHTIDNDGNQLRIHTPDVSVFQKPTKKQIEMEAKRRLATARAKARPGQKIKAQTLKLSTFTGQKLTRREEFVLKTARENQKEEHKKPEFSPHMSYMEDGDISEMRVRYGGGTSRDVDHSSFHFPSPKILTNSIFAANTKIFWTRTDEEDTQ